MSKISRDDLKTILRFGIHLARIDKDFSLPEKKVLKRFYDMMGLSEEERKVLLSQQGSLGGGLGDISSDSAKELLIKLLCVVSFVDGSTSKEEIAFIEKVLEKFHLTFFLLPKEEWGTYEDEVFTTLEGAI